MDLLTYGCTIVTALTSPSRKHDSKFPSNGFLKISNKHRNSSDKLQVYDHFSTQFVTADFSSVFNIRHGK